MPYIGLLSDTHCFFDDKLRTFFQPVEEIWHAGDFGDLQTWKAISEFKPLKGVYGNCDGTQLRERCPMVQSFECGGMKIMMMHIGGYPGRYDYRAIRLIEAHRPQIFICGHSHILKVVNDKHYDMLVVNPGAAGIYGIHQVRTAARFKIENGKIFDFEVGEWTKEPIIN